ncbi:MAG TPA: S41 family peptidase [Candidatus Acidoferrales bacterium]|nr:S41 family peptidase [Candidatus Acidoferrales bacterium]
MLIRRFPLLAFLCALACLLLAPVTRAQTKLLRFPDVHEDKIAFVYGGDLWIASTSGGIATRLTAHPGLELFPKFSPDGKWIAFTGQYDGDEQVYVIPSTGGVPKQLTFYPSRGPLPPRWGYDNQVYGWSADGKSILFRSIRDHFDLGDSQLYTVSVEGGLPKALPMPTSGAGDFSPDGSKMVYSPLFRDFRTWKRYEGGWAQQLYIFDLKTDVSEKITEGPRCNRDPMWIGSKIYFTSDRDNTLNLYSYDPATKKTEELTHSKKWDVRWPGTDHKGQIVYESGGELNVFDVHTGQSRKVSITVPTDGLAMRPSHISVANRIEGAELSPKGERALFVARGDVFTAPIEHGPTRNLTNSSNAHDKAARWSPDGAKIAYISDRSGEEEIWLINQDGSGKPEQITSDSHGMRYDPEWSPDGKRIATADKNGDLYVVTLADKHVVKVAHDKNGQLRDYDWSPDGNFLAFSLTTTDGFRAINIWSLADGQLHQVTGSLFDSNSPSWDPDGNFLYYISVREFQPQLSQIEFNFATNRGNGIFALTLAKDGKSPFPPESDEVTVAKEGDKTGDQSKPADAKADDKKADEKKDDKKDDKKGDAKTGDKKDGKLKEVHIDFDGLAERVTRVPVEADNIFAVSAVPGNILYLRFGSFYYGRESYPDSALVVYSMKDRKDTVLAEKVNGYSVSRNGAKVLVRIGQDFKLFDATPAGKASPKPVSTAGLAVDRIPQQEWYEAFDEVWRRYRDFFYVKNMNGYNWEALRDQYRPLVEFVAHRSDLNYVLGEMVAELDVSHAYLDGGDFDIPRRAPVGLPGARFELDAAAGRYRIARIFHGQNEEELYRAPLTEVGVDAKEGDYVLAIDGKELTAKDNPYELLRNKSVNPVELTLNSKPTFDGARKTSYRPIPAERNLIYLDWVAHNRDYVAQKTGGRIGYIHIPDMGENGIREFIKYYYPQIRKEGMIIDVRGNGGGNISQMIINRLRRSLLGTDFARNADEAFTYPGATFVGPFVCLINETSASDGDIFPYMFRKAGLGPLIGKRTWGGVVGISGHGPLIDGGQVFVPEFATGSSEGQYVIEGHGVDPDIEVQNDPRETIGGKDAQLDRAIAEVTKALETHTHTLPSRPPDPNKSPKR